MWTTPAATGQQQVALADEEDYGSYDQVTKSAVYRLLKELLPTSAAFPSVPLFRFCVWEEFGRAGEETAGEAHALL